MGKNAKKLRSEQRKRAKRSAKEAKRQLYKSYAEQGRKNKKGGSQMQKSSGKHPFNPCGNPGCKNCYANKAA